MRIDASIIISSYNSKDKIGYCLDSIMRQKSACSYEIVVIDSSNDGTAEFIKNLYPSVKLIENRSRVFPGQARNIGIKASQGNIIISTDSDCIADDGWLESIMNIFEKRKELRILGGAIINGTPGHIIGTTEYLVEFNEFTPFQAERDVDIMPTCNICFRREIFEEYGYFDNTIKGSDTLFTRKIFEKGERIYFTPEFKVYHKNRTNLKKILKNQYELGVGSAQVRLKKEMIGSVFVKIPFLIPLLPIIRFVRIGNRLLHQNIKLFCKFLLVMPIVFLALSSYTLGFFDGAMRNAPLDKPKKSN
jgi:GT2 family glycosyltransferase